MEFDSVHTLTNATNKTILATMELPNRFRLATQCLSQAQSKRSRMQHAEMQHEAAASSSCRREREVEGFRFFQGSRQLGLSDPYRKIKNRLHILHIRWSMVGQPGEASVSRQASVKTAAPT